MVERSSSLGDFGFDFQDIVHNVASLGRSDSKAAPVLASMYPHCLFIACK